MRKFKYLFAFSAVALMSLTACGGNKNPYASLPDETNADLIEELTIAQSLANPKDENSGLGVYGNVYLPSEVDGAKISWWSSKPKVIDPKKSGDIAPGEVIRQNKDTEVTLVAQIEKDGNKTKYQQTVTVKAAAPEVADEDYQGYLFAHFVGEGYGKTEGGEKIATGEQMFFALADVGQGLHFKDMNGSTMSNLKPVLSSDVGERGVRDPFMLRSPEGDTFYLIATDLSVYTRGGWNANNGSGKFTITGSHSITIWESHDLVNWTDARLIEVAREDAGMAWAPEMIYHEESGQYVIFFSSTIIDEDSSGRFISERDCIYYTTTRDFVHFGETKKFLKNQPYPAGQEDPQKASDSPKAINNDERKIIDASVTKIGDYYYAAAKDGDNHEDGGILIQRNSDLFDIDGWEKVLDLDDLGFQAQGRTANNQCLEGPEWFIYNQADREDAGTKEYGLMADFYANTSVGYIPWKTTDVEDATNANDSWKLLTSGADNDYSWDNQTKRHGTILRITAEEAARIKESYPNS